MCSSFLRDLPPERRLTGSGAVGLDIGPSDIAMVSDGDAALENFCPEVEQPWRELRRIERAMDRSRRATNPDAFNADGTWRRGAKATVRSRRYQQLAIKRRERERRLLRNASGRMANWRTAFLGQGTEIHLEKLSYRSFQRAVGPIGQSPRAGRICCDMLSRKVKAAGGTLIEINTFKTALSQFDHTTGEFVKKPLAGNQRTHYFGDGLRRRCSAISIQPFSPAIAGRKPLISAKLNGLGQTAEPLLRRAMSRENQSASGQGFVLPQALRHLRADRPSKVDGWLRRGRGCCSASESPGEFGHMRHQNHARFSCRLDRAFIR